MLASSVALQLVGSNYVLFGSQISRPNCVYSLVVAACRLYGELKDRAGAQDERSVANDND